MTYLVFLDSEENNDKVECLSKLSSIEDFLLNKAFVICQGSEGTANNLRRLRIRLVFRRM